jgi:hypothetical protein
MNFYLTFSIHKTTLLFIFVLQFFFANAQLINEEITIYSPNKERSVLVSAKEGTLTYSVLYKGEILINTSSLGFQFKFKSDPLKEIFTIILLKLHLTLQIIFMKLGNQFGEQILLIKKLVQ